MDHRDPTSVPPLENAHGLGRQGDLRHEHDDAAPPLEGPVDRREDDVRLARSRDAVEQRRAGLSRVDQLRDRVKRRGLFFGEHGLFFGLCIVRVGIDGKGIAVGVLLGEGKKSRTLKRLRGSFRSRPVDSGGVGKRAELRLLPGGARRAEGGKELLLIPAPQSPRCRFPFPAVRRV